MENYKELEWYVMYHDFNRDMIVPINIFRNTNLSNKKFGIPKLLKQYKSYNEFKEELKNLFKYAYHSKAEYEILVSGLFDWNIQYKLDIWYQIEPNIDIIAKYIIETYNKHKRKK